MQEHTDLWDCGMHTSIQANVHKPFYSYTNMILPKLLYFARYNVAFSNCAIDNSCVIHNGVCIGQDGKA
jgi:hypothetical protein